MRFDELVLLKQTYDERHGAQPESDYDSIRKIHGIYSTVMGIERMSQTEKDGLADYYKNLKQNGAPAYYWIIDAIYVTSRKSEVKRKFEYLIGILKKWRQYGYGYIPSNEESEIVDYFEEVVGENLPDSHRYLISELMTSYGAVGVTRMIGSLHQYSKSYAFLCLLKDLLQDKYITKKFNAPELPLGSVTNSESQATLSASSTVSTAAVSEKSKEQKQEEKTPTRKNRRPIYSKDDYLLFGELLVSYLINLRNKEARSVDMYEYLTENGLDYDKRNRDRLFKRITDVFPAIEKCGNGMYRLNEDVYRKMLKQDNVQGNSKNQQAS